MKIQMSHRRCSEVGGGDRWILTTPLYEDKKEFDIPTVYLLIKHDYSCNKDGESDKPQTLLYYDNGEFRIIVTEVEYAQMVYDIQEHEGIGDAAAQSQLEDKYMTDEYCHLVHGWNPLNKSKEMWKRWQAIKLLVTPHVTM